MTKNKPIPLPSPQSGRRRPLYVPPGGPPRAAAPSREIYATMGEANVFALLADVYEAFGRSSIKEMFPADLQAASEKSAAFFVGMFGGPPIYHERYGSPMLRARHTPFPIDEVARQVWLACFDDVLDRAVADYAFPAEHLPGFRRFLHEFSGWMVNTSD